MFSSVNELSAGPVQLCVHMLPIWRWPLTFKMGRTEECITVVEIEAVVGGAEADH